jgi:hypothetical protein
MTTRRSVTVSPERGIRERLMTATAAHVRRGRLGYAFAHGRRARRIAVAAIAAVRPARKVVPIPVVHASLAVDPAIVDQAAWLSWADKNLSPHHAQLMRQAAGAVSN